MVLTVSCREVFYPDDIVSEERIPVIQGNILENQSRGLLSWAANYEGSSTDHIGGANVWITDDSGNSKKLHGIGSRKVSPEDETYTGTCGREYVLHVEIDGEF